MSWEKKHVEPDGREYKVAWYGFPWFHLRPISIALDNHSIDIGASFLPLFDTEIDIVYRPNYWVKRGIAVYLTILGLQLSVSPGPGEREVEDDGDNA